MYFPKGNLTGLSRNSTVRAPQRSGFRSTLYFDRPNGKF